MGRKPISGERKRGQIIIRVTEEERALLDAAAGEKGTSTWLRELGLRVAKRRRKKSAGD